mgnify:CR=1 FL=1
MTFKRIMKIINIKNTLILLNLSVFFIFIGCESTTQNTIKIKEITEKTSKIINLKSDFEIITTFNNKQIDLFVQEYGKFDLKRTDGDLSFQRLDKGSCRVFVQSSILTGNINSILVFHLKKKTFYPQFQLQRCLG